MRLTCGVESEELQAFLDRELGVFSGVRLHLHARRCAECSAEARGVLGVRARLRDYGGDLWAQAQEMARRETAPAAPARQVDERAARAEYPSGLRLALGIALIVGVLAAIPSVVWVKHAAERRVPRSAVVSAHRDDAWFKPGYDSSVRQGAVWTMCFKEQELEGVAERIAAAHAAALAGTSVVGLKRGEGPTGPQFLFLLRNEELGETGVGSVDFGPIAQSGLYQLASAGQYESYYEDERLLPKAIKAEFVRVLFPDHTESVCSHRLTGIRVRLRERLHFQRWYSWSQGRWDEDFHGGYVVYDVTARDETLGLRRHARVAFGRRTRGEFLYVPHEAEWEKPWFRGDLWQVDYSSLRPSRLGEYKEAQLKQAARAELSRRWGRGHEAKVLTLEMGRPVGPPPEQQPSKTPRTREESGIHIPVEKLPVAGHHVTAGRDPFYPDQVYFRYALEVPRYGLRQEGFITLVESPDNHLWFVLPRLWALTYRGYTDAAKLRAVVVDMYRNDWLHPGETWQRQVEGPVEADGALLFTVRYKHKTLGVEETSTARFKQRPDGSWAEERLLGD